ncbi:MAG: YicC/YloC family endoribonuclease [Burkholderiaceae bacterium]|nr:YicC/YloC family endoribonuclease [Burkholderiaceae bacterium]
MRSAERRPIQSMTGYAQSSRNTAAGQLAVELRSVNARFLDLVIRAPDELRSAEPALRELVGAAVLRGKLECRLALRAGGRADETDARVDERALARFVAIAQQVAQSMPQAAAPTVVEALRWPGVIADEAPQVDPSAEVVEVAGEALAEFVASRVREGAKLIAFVLERADAIDAIVAPLAARSPELIDAWQRKLVERLREALEQTGAAIPVEETMARVRQEVAAYGLRIDVAEEIGRLQAHVAELRRVLSGPGPVGKRLDFLLQELNREANTLGSKAAAIDLTGASIELKVLIEQIREQVQNLE